MDPHRTRHTLRTIAGFEAAKGLLALMAASGLLLFMHHDVHALTHRLAGHLHLNPATHLPHVLARIGQDIGVLDPRWLLAGTVVYAGFRFVEAFGLWHQRAWAEWLAAFSGGVYVPFEVVELLRHHGWLSAAALALNLLVVGFMVQALRARHRAALVASANLRGDHL
ncbi:MAG: DUF2127 domain-containing protein [Moraxellaceae bacterium]|nr:DUF2127 domain-containing protein [Moraxellaceae bacterium]